jgi:hypothetical protein
MSVHYDILIVHRHWPDILERAVKSIRQFSDAHIIAVDDCSPAEESVEGFWHVVKEYGLDGIRALIHSQHGACLDMALSRSKTPWVITCDSDMIINDAKAFEVLLDKCADDVGAAGRMANNKMSALFGKFVHPAWAVWNAAAIKRHYLSFAAFTLQRGETWTFATAQFLNYRLACLGDRPWEAKDKPLKLAPVNLYDYVTHAQVWQERGGTWKEEVKLG